MKLLMRGSYANTSKALFICYENCFLNWFQLAKNSRVFAKPILGQAQQTLVGDNMGKQKYCNGSNPIFLQIEYCILALKPLENWQKSCITMQFISMTKHVYLLGMPNISKWLRTRRCHIFLYLRLQPTNVRWIRNDVRSIGFEISGCCNSAGYLSVLNCRIACSLQL